MQSLPVRGGVTAQIALQGQPSGRKRRPGVPQEEHCHDLSNCRSLDSAAAKMYTLKECQLFTFQASGLKQLPEVANKTPPYQCKPCGKVQTAMC